MPLHLATKGQVERKHLHIGKMGLAMLFNGHISHGYWVHVFRSIVYIINRLSSFILGNRSPFELLIDTSPSYAHFFPFGCRVYL